MKPSDLTKEQPIFIDSHAHLELEPLVNDPDSVIARAGAAGVAAIICVGIDLDDAGVAIDIVERFDNVYGSVGFHPHNAKDVTDSSLESMIQLAQHPRVVAYGEIGLDFFRNLSPQGRQKAVFSDQLAMAKNLAKPVVIHLRNAYSEGLDMLEQFAPYPAGGVIHCFSGNREDAERSLDLGFYISIPGPITYKKNQELRSIVSNLPMDRVLLETDCPFLAPEPFRGKDNEPALIVHTAARVAEIWGISLKEVARITTGNAIRLFGLPLKQTG